MYINQFWCGVIATIIVEVVLIVIGCIYFNKNDKKENK